jgi:phosphonate ABC transporter permease subunit PhnE
MSSLALSVLGCPVGMYLGGEVAGWVRTQSERLSGKPLLTLAGLAVCVVVIWLSALWAFPSEEEERRPNISKRLGRIAAMLAAAITAIFFLYLLADIAVVTGDLLEDALGSFGFLGAFVSSLGEILHLLVALIAALVGGAAVSSLLGRLGTLLYKSLPRKWVFVAALALGAAAGAMVAGLVTAGLNWLYEYKDFTKVFALFILAGAGLGALTAVLTRKRDAIPIGIVIYNITRTVLNILRAIEALIWVIIFVVWVGIGPFAGVLALTLHTIASLAKLYSEQVESISPGPLEAVKATGATRLQTIVYAVIPQIVPPYISFTIYRWDINVRMSTIIGFAGGGGIGFLLFQNINLLNYRAASAQMVAIAVVVALMDYFSTWLRNKVV